MPVKIAHRLIPLDLEGDVYDIMRIRYPVRFGAREWYSRHSGFPPSAESIVLRYLTRSYTG